MNPVLFGLILLVFSAPSFADDGLTAGYAACIGKANGVAMDMIDRMDAETKHQDRHPDTAYAKVMKSLASARQDALRETERARLAFRKANCGFHAAPDGGSYARILANQVSSRPPPGARESLRTTAAPDPLS